MRKFILATFVGWALLVFVPVEDAQAQPVTAIPVCFFDAASVDDVYVQYATASGSGFTCPASSTPIPLQTQGVPILGICFEPISHPTLGRMPTYARSDGTPSGGITCIDPQDSSTNDDILITRAQFRSATGTTPTPTPTPTRVGTTPTPRGGGGGGPIPTNPAEPGQGTCEQGFHQEGPLCVPNNPFDPDSIAAARDIRYLAARIIQWALALAGIVAVIMAIIGGYQIMTAAGDAAKATNGRKTLTNAIIGLVIVVLSYMVVQIVYNFITS